MGLGYPLELIGYLGGPIVLSYALLTLVVINVAPVFIDLEDAPRLYQYAKAFPLWNQVEASRHVSECRWQLAEQRVRHSR